MSGKAFSVCFIVYSTAWPCLKERFDDAAISNCYSFNATLGIERLDGKGEIGEFKESGGLMLSINEFLELRAVSNVDCNV
jgi:hypothetical protein